MYKIYLLLLLLIPFSLTAQEPEELKEVIVSSSRIQIPFSKDSRSISIITKAEIEASPASSLSELLQEVAGLDIRRRGTNGMQADLYIRGGSFDQTLILIDGIKMDDAQTGHHILNAALPLELIERIEIIKGPAARIYGQNAFTGAVNIVTKKKSRDQMTVALHAGSFQQLGAAVTGSNNFENSAHLVHYSRNASQGYRYNTDYDNQNYFLKSEFNTQKRPIEVLGLFTERKFGANGFYASPSAINQYEETQTSLLGISTEFKKENISLTPQIYWRRNQDLYIYDRQNPTGYRNLHLSNKIGAQINGSYHSSMGITGFGLNFEKVDLASNNLGDRDRNITTVFLEQRFNFFNDRIDFTPGVALSYYSDFKFHFFPGFDAGIDISENFKVYTNVGYTYRIPTYTDLYYSDPTTLGNENLKPEEAISEEIGLKYLSPQLQMALIFFNRDSKNLMDFIKYAEEDRFEATNIRRLNTKGFETSLDYKFSVLGLDQKFKLGYTFLDDKIKELEIPFSRYSINSLRHQFIVNFSARFIKNFSQTILYKYNVRTAGEAYGIVDIAANYQEKNFEISLSANNIFNQEYSETNLVPMPKGNILLEVKYRFN